jgi:hypothetical protein
MALIEAPPIMTLYKLINCGNYLHSMGLGAVHITWMGVRSFLDLCVALLLAWKYVLMIVRFVFRVSDSRYYC